ncbi:UDP-N-acetylglucosamine 4,6-dehydratase [Flavobacteriales bacterium]|nr:UDP-N-acetylglucosamine 4,6-dehydratase [Flavobacteriales bacterium]
MNFLNLLKRNKYLFVDDISNHNEELNEIVRKSSFLVLGGAGSIGQAVSKEIFKRSPKKLHVVDISENNLVELVRDIRSAFGYTKGEFKTFAIDVGSIQYDVFIKNDGKYDYVLNLSALKHVRSEKDPYTLMRMIDVNIFNTEKTLLQSIEKGVKKYFCVSTDKAANPVNMMGASKKIMEMYVNRRSKDICVSMARFANVAFSDGSLLHGFNQRLLKKQPIVAPNDIRRYFVTPEESGQLCLLSCVFGENRDIFFPKLSEHLQLITFSDIAEKYLKDRNLIPYYCYSEDEAREAIKKLDLVTYWPCLFSKSDTTGEKDFEEFFTAFETLNLNRFNGLGIIKNELEYENDKLDYFTKTIDQLRDKKSWEKNQLVSLFYEMIPDFGHMEKGKYLDSKM